MLGSDVVSRARYVLNDADATRWTDAELALWINDGCRLIAIARPDSCAVEATMSLAAGSKQTIAGLTPPGLRLLDVVRATASGRGIKLVDRQVLDAYEANWHAATQAVPVHWVFDPRTPKTFYVYPPALVNTQVDLVYTRDPITVAAGTLGSQTLSIDDIYIGALTDYVLFRAYAKDSDETHNAGLAAGYLAAAQAALGVKTDADRAASPDFNSAAGRPEAAAAAGGT